MNTRCTSAKRRRAFTLMEVLVGIGLTGLAASMLIVVLPTTTKGQVTSHEYLQICDIAQAKIDRLKDLGYGRLKPSELISAGIATASSSDSNYTFTLSRGGSASMDAQGTITLSDYNANIKQVDIDINWASGGSTQTPRNYHLTGLIARE